MRSTKIVPTILFSLALPISAAEMQTESPECLKDYSDFIRVISGEGEAAVTWLIPIYKRSITFPTTPDRKPVSPLNAIPPRYPSEAMKDGIEGGVCFIFDLTNSGDIKNLRMYNTFPRRVFDRVAAEAFVRWKFPPVSQEENESDRKDVKYCLDFKL